MAEHIIAVIGSGGKTTALGVLARQCGKQAVLVTTTTKIFPRTPAGCGAYLADPDPETLRDALAAPGIVCAGARTARGKLASLPEETLHAAMAVAGVVVYEADGSRGLPLKLHRSGEPVLLPGTTGVLVVAGLSALGRPVGEAVHRWELAADWRKQPSRPVEGDVFVRCVLETADSAGVPYGQIRVFLNQADACADPALAEIVAAQLRSRGLQTRTGSLRDDPEGLYGWVTTKQ